MAGVRAQSSGSSAGEDPRLERAIVLHLLSEEAEQGCSRAALAAALGSEARALGQALERLSDAGVVGLDGAYVRASCAARRIDELGLIGI